MITYNFYRPHPGNGEGTAFTGTTYMVGKHAYRRMFAISVVEDDEEKPRICDGCFVFDSEKSLLKHQQVCSGEKPGTTCPEYDVDAAVKDELSDVHVGLTDVKTCSEELGLRIESVQGSVVQKHKTKSKRKKRLDPQELVCRFCGKVFLAKESLVKHVRVHTGEKPYKCDQCDQAFAQSSGLKQHAVKHSDEKIHCDECNKSFCTKYYLVFHKQIHSNEREKRFKCEKCAKEFDRNYDLKRHTVLHDTRKAFPCNHCDKSFFRNFDLKKHRMTHHDGAVEQEQTTGNTTVMDSETNSYRGTDTVRIVESSSDRINGVSQSVNMNAMEKSGEMSDSFTAQQAIVKMETSHEQMSNTDKMNIARVQDSTGEDNNEVAEVKWSFTKANFKDNENQAKKMQHACDQCGKSFNTKSYLVAHRRLHTGEKPYQCNECGELFALNAGLKQHAQKHSKEKIQCDICGKSFCTKYYLGKHKLIHGGERKRPFKCDNCDKAFERKWGLIRHKVTHAATKPFKCALCNKTFSWSWSFKKHLLMHENAMKDKKVLLRERKRHTARRVASTRCAALSNPDLVWGVPHPRSGGGYRISSLGGYPVSGLGGTPS